MKDFEVFIPKILSKRVFSQMFTQFFTQCFISWLFQFVVFISRHFSTMKVTISIFPDSKKSSQMSRFSRPNGKKPCQIVLHLFGCLNVTRIEVYRLQSLQKRCSCLKQAACSPKSGIFSVHRMFLHTTSQVYCLSTFENYWKHPRCPHKHTHTRTIPQWQHQAHCRWNRTLRNYGSGGPNHHWEICRYRRG